MTCEEKLNDIQSKVNLIKAKTDLIPNTIATDIATLISSNNTLELSIARTMAMLDILYLEVMGEQYVSKK